MAHIYRTRLSEFAVSVLDNVDSSPWYLRQQALLFLAVNQQPQATSRKTTPENRHYAYLQGLLRGKWPVTSSKQQVKADISVPLCLIAHRIGGATKATASAHAKWIESAPNAVVTDHLRYIVEYDELFDAAMTTLSASNRKFWRRLRG